MQIQELRIGNLVFDHLGRILKVSGIKDEYVYCALSNGEKVKYHINTFKPIKITTEILIQLGFEKCNGWDDMELWREKDWEQKGGNYFDLEEMNNGFEQPSCAKCEFVHQLQNSYYQHWLNGTELSTKNLLEKCKS